MASSSQKLHLPGASGRAVSGAFVQALGLTTVNGSNGTRGSELQQLGSELSRPGRVPGRFSQHAGSAGSPCRTGRQRSGVAAKTLYCTVHMVRNPRPRRIPGGTGHWRGRGWGHGAGVARATSIFLAWGGAGLARAWRGHVLFPQGSFLAAPAGLQGARGLDLGPARADQVEAPLVRALHAGGGSFPVDSTGAKGGGAKNPPRQSVVIPRSI
eukprot:gene23481-biopygen22314